MATMHLLAPSVYAIGVLGGLLLLSPCATFSQTIPCTLCEGGAYPSDPSARYKLSAEMTLNCSQLFDIAPTLTDEDDCIGIQEIGKTICQCNPEDVPPCMLCSDGSALPNPDAEVVPGKTCADLEKNADDDFDSNCPVWQGTAGIYCNCSNADLDFDLCHICPGKLLPYPFKVVTFVDGGSKTCMELAIDVNRNNGDCGRYQQLYAEECGCFESDVTPSPAPSDGYTNSVSQWTKVSMCAAGVLCLIAFQM